MNSEFSGAIDSGVADRQLFRQLIRSSATHRNNSASILVDGQHRCGYPEIPSCLDGIKRFLTELSVAPGDSIALEVNNSVRGALSVLALLDSGYSFILLPVRGQGVRVGSSSATAPEFCRWVLSVDTDNSMVDSNLCEPSTYLRMVLNPHFDPTTKARAEDDPRLFFRTSGSLESAKLVMYRYRPFYQNVLNLLRRREFNSSHRIALPTPIFHTYGLRAGLLAGLAGGASIDLQERSNILKFLERENAFQPNVAYLTPSFCEMLVRARKSPRPYEFLVTSGDCIRESVFRRCEALHGPLVTQYGTTEMGVISSSKPQEPYDLRRQTVGRPLDGVEYRIKRISTVMVSEHAAGKLQICNAFGFEGYVDSKGNEVVLQATYDGRWYQTGDLATTGVDGTLVILGRYDLSVNRSGVLLLISEVENWIRELEGVEEVAVAAGRDCIRGRSLLAFCVVNPRSEITDGQLRTAFAANAPTYSVPDEIHLVSEIPKLQNGKIDRQALARLADEVSPDFSSV